MLPQTHVTRMRAGQVRPYGDTVYEWLIEITEAKEEDVTDKDVWDYCQKNLQDVEGRRKDGYIHDGSCGFPFGLESFASLDKDPTMPLTWRYTVTEPWCD